MCDLGIPGTKGEPGKGGGPARRGWGGPVTSLVAGTEGAHFSRAQLHGVILKGAPGKAKRELGSRLLSKVPTGVRSLGVDRELHCHSPVQQLRELCPHHGGHLAHQCPSGVWLVAPAPVVPDGGAGTPGQAGH